MNWIKITDDVSSYPPLEKEVLLLGHDGEIRSRKLHRQVFRTVGGDEVVQYNFSPGSYGIGWVSYWAEIEYPKDFKTTQDAQCENMLNEFREILEKAGR